MGAGAGSFGSSIVAEARARILRLEVDACGRKTSGTTAGTTAGAGMDGLMSAALACDLILRLCPCVDLFSFFTAMGGGDGGVAGLAIGSGRGTGGIADRDTDGGGTADRDGPDGGCAIDRGGPEGVDSCREIGFERWGGGIVLSIVFGRSFDLTGDRLLSLSFQLNLISRTLSFRSPIISAMSLIFRQPCSCLMLLLAFFKRSASFPKSINLLDSIFGIVSRVSREIVKIVYIEWRVSSSIWVF